MASHMEITNPKRVIPENNNQNHSPNTEDMMNRPYKLQRLAIPTLGSTSNILQIPEFVGPIPTFSHEANNHQQQSQARNHLHNEEDKNQEQQRTPHQSSRNHTDYN
ncbi:hypothetical protein TSUD_153820 [Trifolium subterraneum]|uniref:Uncharacterized protein n=1 Tax=Trifolium subterraneum TaxID=3900 RepID=A0A2Z6M961_TRISU|nr:hypothetical protein TSUD_153820 [Trifolium subterraneum]